MFVDRVIVSFRAGDGGDGSRSFRREKFIPRGGPDGGDGGKGGDIVLLSSPICQSLTDFKYQRQFVAGDGGDGARRKCTGRDGDDVVLKVPAGTVVKTFPDEKLVFDFDRLDRRFVIARGGKGGRGNVHFKSSVNQAPRRAEKGEKGESIQVVLELKLIAGAGLVGLPNAGKSTLISRISNARPKIADYPFTTLFPNLGVVDYQGRSMVVADIPGILEGAHRGQGMGLEFLRHIERTRVLLFVIDASPYAPLPPLRAFQVLRGELERYQPQLLRKKVVVAANKADLLGADRSGVDALRNFCRRRTIPFVEISALKATNLDPMKKALFAVHEPA
jgi:GTP-binding protein